MSRKRNRILFYGTRAIGTAILLSIYILGLRPARIAFTQQFVLPIISPYANKADSSFHVIEQRTGFTLAFQWNGVPMQTQYKPQLGFFFLVAVIALIFITLRVRWYWYLISFHIIVLLIATGILLFSRRGWYLGFIIADFMIAYLVPALTLIYVPIVHYITNKNKTGKKLF